MTDPFETHPTPAVLQRIDPAVIELLSTQPINISVFVAGPAGIEVIEPA